MSTTQPDFHTHKDEHGAIVKCFHRTKSMLMSVDFYIATIISFPIEHWLYEKGPLHFISVWMGL
jgi:hypothetical protein